MNSVMKNPSMDDCVRDSLHKSSGLHLPCSKTLDAHKKEREKHSWIFNKFLILVTPLRDKAGEEGQDLIVPQVITTNWL